MNKEELDKIIAEAGDVVAFGRTITGSIPGLASTFGKVFGGGGDEKLAQIGEDEIAILRNTTLTLIELKAFEDDTRIQFARVLTAINKAVNELKLSNALNSVNAPLSAAEGAGIKYKDALEAEDIKNRQDLISFHSILEGHASQFLRQANTTAGIAFASLLPRIYSLFFVDCQLVKAVGDKEWPNRVDAYVEFIENASSKTMPAARTGALGDYRDQLRDITDYEGGQLVSAVETNNGGHNDRGDLLGYFIKHVQMELRIEDAERVADDFVKTALGTK